MSLISKIVSKFSGLSQEETARAAAEKTVTPGMPEILRRAAAEGAVLLKNDGLLPLQNNETLALFGRVQSEWFYTGYGSGGDVNKPYAVNLIEGVRNCPSLTLYEPLANIYADWSEKNQIDHGIWGHWPRFYPEMPVSESLAADAAANADCAVVTIGRSSGEDRENALEKGSFYLTDDEKTLLETVTGAFSKTVVLLNVGSLMDLSWLEEFGEKIGAVLLVWQGGMESGNAVADLLCGAVCPSGRLSDTIARQYESYPSANDFGAAQYNNYTEDIFVGYRWFETFSRETVLYPFGFGLSYTDFALTFTEFKAETDGFALTCEVKNNGEKHSGKTVAQIYAEPPCGVLGTPTRVLCGFVKTRTLAPGEAQTLTVKIPKSALASYDESGAAGYASAFVLQAGVYGFYLGENVRDAVRVVEYTQESTELLEQLEQAAAPVESFMICKAKEENGTRVLCREPVYLSKINLQKRIAERLPDGVKMTGDRGIKLCDVRDGKASMDEFVAQLDLTELEAISRGAYIMNSPLGVPGNAGVYGGVLPSLRDKGVPPVTTTDGPSGIRLHSCCSLLPIGTLLACTFDEALVEELYRALGAEMRDKGTDVLLAPGINIHRNPLCGRNFEYYSEDPLLTGKIAAAAVRGLQSNGVSACVKHFACNNQEYRRSTNDSRVSERALREIYLKGFEICVKEAAPQNIMTSYNKINGVHGHYQYELCTTVLRGEWHYAGCVMTDWWMRSQNSPEFPKLRDNAYRVRGQVDVLMPGGKRVGKQKPDKTLLKTYGKKDGITLGELQRTAKNVLRFCMQSTAMERFLEKQGK